MSSLYRAHLLQLTRSQGVKAKDKATILGPLAVFKDPCLVFIMLLLHFTYYTVLEYFLSFQ